MTPETKQKKRKAAASAPSPIAKKVKPAPAARSRMKAADFTSDGSESEGGWEVLEEKEKGGKKRKEGSVEKKRKKNMDKKSKKGKKDKEEKEKEKKNKKDKVEEVEELEEVEEVEELEEVEEVEEVEKKEELKKKEAKKEELEKKEAKKEKKKIKNSKDIIPLDAPAPAEDGAADSEEEEIDDQTATLLKGFESSDDEDERGEDAVQQVDRAKMATAQIPDGKRVKKRVAGLGGDKPTPGVLYLGRIPHGFYEQEMRSYFSQFGTVTRLRLSRNKKTGHSKHYAFLEFADQGVAQIVAETMDNYLLFGHILKCKIVPRDDLEFVERLFKGANKRFKPRPGAKLQKALQERKRTVEDWGKKQARERARRRRAVEGLKAKGIEYEFEIPELETPAGVEAGVIGAPEAPEAVEKAVEEAVAQNDGVEEAQVVVKKRKKPKEPKSPAAKVKKSAKKPKA